MRALAEGIDDQVEVAVTIEINQRAAGRRNIGAGHAGGLGFIGEPPVAQVAIQTASPIEAAKKQIAPAVAIHVTRRHAGAVEENLIGEMALLREDVGKSDSALRRRQASETGAR